MNQWIFHYTLLLCDLRHWHIILYYVKTICFDISQLDLLICHFPLAIDVLTHLIKIYKGIIDVKIEFLQLNLMATNYIVLSTNLELSICMPGDKRKSNISTVVSRPAQQWQLVALHRQISGEYLLPYSDRIDKLIQLCDGVKSELCKMTDFH